MSHSLAGVTQPPKEAAMAATKEKGIGVKELAEKLGTTPHILRAFIRTQDLGVGRGSRYRWTGMGDATVKRIVAAWEATSN
jgi:transposase-like protein